MEGLMIISTDFIDRFIRTQRYSLFLFTVLCCFSEPLLLLKLTCGSTVVSSVP
ncbi:hypothetical protein BDV10DRAFT_179559 [Aspergillus recurvatus]